MLYQTVYAIYTSIILVSISFVALQHNRQKSKWHKLLQFIHQKAITSWFDADDIIVADDLALPGATTSSGMELS